MRIFFRVDSSTQMGTGHLMRCLTLAHELKGAGVEISFICRDLPGNLCSLIAKKNYELFLLPKIEDLRGLDRKENIYSAWLGADWQLDAKQSIQILRKEKQGVDWLVVDHYALDVKWEKEMRSYVKKIMVIDDLADRFHDCDLLLDQNLCQNMNVRYQNLVPQQCQLFLGPQYALLRSEFTQMKKKLRKRDGFIKRILIFFGGSDLTNETTKALKAVLRLRKDNIQIDVVVGKSNPYKEQIKNFCSDHSNINYYCQISNMAQLMNDADLAIGAGGSTTWERCYLGLPAIILVIAENQLEITAAVAKTGAIHNLGWCTQVRVEDITRALQKMIDNPSLVKEISNVSLKIMGNKLANIISHRLKNMVE